MAAWNDKLGEFDFYLMRKNIKTEDEVTQEEDTGKSQPSLLQGLREDQLLKHNFLRMVLIWCCTSSGFYIIIYNMKYFKGNLFTNQYLGSLAQIMAIITCGF